jgi:hypothetical protein
LNDAGPDADITTSLHFSPDKKVKIVEMVQAGETVEVV